MLTRFQFMASRPTFAVPAGACDCHTHGFGPVERYPFAPTRAYAPMDALPEDARTMMARLGLDRILAENPAQLYDFG